MLRLQPPVKTNEQLRAIAASGSSGLSTAAKAELRRRTLAGLAKAVSQ